MSNIKFEKCKDKEINDKCEVIAVMSDEIAELREMSDTGKSVRASAVMEFVNMIRGAYEAGFVDNNPTTYDVYRSAQVHVKDMYGVDTDNWDDELSRESRRNNHDRMADEIAELREALQSALNIESLWLPKTNMITHTDEFCALHKVHDNFKNLLNK